MYNALQFAAFIAAVVIYISAILAGAFEKWGGSIMMSIGMCIVSCKSRHDVVAGSLNSKKEKPPGRRREILRRFLIPVLFFIRNDYEVGFRILGNL